MTALCFGVVAPLSFEPEAQDAQYPDVEEESQVPSSPGFLGSGSVRNMPWTAFGQKLVPEEERASIHTPFTPIVAALSWQTQATESTIDTADTHHPRPIKI